MERGVLVEKGTHEELYALNGVYTQLVNKQKLSVTKNNGFSAETEGQGPLPQESGSSENISKILQQLMLTLESPAQLVQEARARVEEEKALHLQSIGDSPEGMFTKVYHALRPERKILLLGTACAGLNGLVFPGFAFLLGFIIQEIMQPLDIMLKYGMANMFISCLLVVAVFALLGTWGQTSLFGKANANLTSRFRLAMFENILTSEMGFFDSKVNAVGTLVNKLGSVAQVPCFVTDVWGGTANLAFTAIYGVGLSMVFCVPLAGVLVCLLPFMFLLAWWQCVAISRFAAASKESLDQSTQVATESMREVKTLKTLIREEFAVCRYEAFLDRPFQLSMRNAVLDSIAYALQASSIMFTIALGLFVGQKFLEKGIITEFWRVTVVILGMCVSMVSLAGSASLAQAWAKGRFAALTTYAILERRTAIDPLKKGIIPKHFSAGFHFNNLVFQYPTSTQRIFNGHFTLTGAENKSLALVGPSGSGKSTVIGLLQRWYDPIRGKALLGNIPIADYDIMEGLRSNMALVGQEPVLFDMSIAENIAWGSEKPVTQAEIEAAARQANAHTFVMNMPQGYDTRVGNKGDQLSGGQKQRIAIARALIRKPKLLLLDEATSALDSTSEQEVQNAIDGASVGRTTVTIAHRLSTIKNVDCIAVVTGGQIVEAGRHDELVAQNGVYADLCRKQGL